MKIGRPNPAQEAFYAWLLYQRDGASSNAHAHVWQHLERALESDRNCTRALYYKGVLFARGGRYAQALPHLERAHELDPSDRNTARVLQLVRAGRRLR